MPIEKVRAAGLIIMLLALSPAWSAPEEEEEQKLLGRITAEQLAVEPYSEWFDESYEEYTPNPVVVAELMEVDRAGLEITLFFGTWCGDSQREIPRLLRLFDTLELADDMLTVVAVDHVDGATKTSPTGEEKGLEVYRVPTVVVSRDGEEVARIVEHPVLSLERDLLAILSGEPYEPNYITYPTIRRWLEEGLLSDENVSPRGLAGQIRHEIRSEGELMSPAGVLMSRGETAEAVMLHRVNCALYPDSSRALGRLAEALQKVGENEEAREAAEEALRLNTDPRRVKELVELIEGAGS
jgi:thiol-disulfide isomerase/thioredoxin